MNNEQIAVKSARVKAKRFALLVKEGNKSAIQINTKFKRSREEKIFTRSKGVKANNSEKWKSENTRFAR